MPIETLSQRQKSLFPITSERRKSAPKPCVSAQSCYWLRHFHKWQDDAELGISTWISISNALRILARLKTSDRPNLLSSSIGHLYVYSIMTTAFLEGVIWQLTVSAPSARLFRLQSAILIENRAKIHYLKDTKSRRKIMFFRKFYYLELRKYSVHVFVCLTCYAFNQSRKFSQREELFEINEKKSLNCQKWLN